MNYALEAHDISKRYDTREALRAVSLAVPIARVHGLLGPNGAGKTTLLRVLLGLTRPDTGRVELLGLPRMSMRETLPPKVAGFVETPRFYPYLSGTQNLALLARLDRTDKSVDTSVAAVLDRVGLAHDAHAAVGAYSSGMRQRLGIAAMLLRSPRLMLLDEPTSTLDPGGATDIRTMIRRLGDADVTVLLSSHDMGEIEELCASVTFLREGRVAFEGTVDQMRALAPADSCLIHTSDDDHARALAAANPQVRVLRGLDPVGFELIADTPALDRYVVELGCAGVAVRRLERKRQSLDEVFLQLAGRR